MSWLVMPRRSVYVPDLPPQKRQRSSFVRTGPPAPARPDTAPPQSPPDERPAAKRRPATTAIPAPPERLPSTAPVETASPDADAAPANTGEVSGPNTTTLARNGLPKWILQVRNLDLVSVAEVLGYEVTDDRIRPCPRCGDPDGAEIHTNKKGWTLWRCRACATWNRGNVDLASYALSGEKAGDLPPNSKALLQQWFADQGWCEPPEDEDDAGDE